MTLTRAVLVFVILGTGCSRPGAQENRRSAADAPTSSAPPLPGVLGPKPLYTWLDPQATREIITARANFDAAEAAALAESERTIGPYRDIMIVTARRYREQRAGSLEPVARSDAWRGEQRRRAAYAYFVLQPKIDAARNVLARHTVRALRLFFRREVASGRISRFDYRRYTAQLRKGYFPDFRGRKWTGTAVYEFRAADVSPEYAIVLQEVRRLWLAQNCPHGAIVWKPATPELYRDLGARRINTVRTDR